MMSDQAKHWTRVAGDYEKEFIDPYRADVRNPLTQMLRRLPGCKAMTVADFGCGIGPLLPLLAKRFQKVYGVDFAAGMLARARERIADNTNVELKQLSFLDLQPLHGLLDVATSVNSLVLPDVRDLQQALVEIHSCLKPGGRFLGIVPAMDGIHYYTMLALERALETGMSLEAAWKNAGHHAEHEYYDFAFGQFEYKSLKQHFWQPFEIRFRLRKAGFTHVRLRKVRLSWSHFGLRKELQHYPASWDWYFQCKRSTEP